MAKNASAKKFCSVSDSIFDALERSGLDTHEQLIALGGSYYSLRRVLVAEIGEELVLELEQTFADATRRVNELLETESR